MDSQNTSLTPSTRRCYKCKLEKSVSEFHSNGGRARLICAQCRNEESKTVGTSKDKTDLKAEIARRIEKYGYDALKALHEIAMMKTEDHRLLQIKFMAASRLAPAGGADGMNVGVDQRLIALNEQYQKTAPRIKEVRERTVTFYDEPTASDSCQPAVLDAQPLN